jgi:ABC-type antimicrobial peptide transport system ATPase subunit
LTTDNAIAAAAFQTLNGHSFFTEKKFPKKCAFPQQLAADTLANEIIIAVRVCAKKKVVVSPRPVLNNARPTQAQILRLVQKERRKERDRDLMQVRAGDKNAIKRYTIFLI